MILSNNLTTEEVEKIKNRTIDICDLLANKEFTNKEETKACFFFKSSYNEGYMEKAEFQPYLLDLSLDERAKLKLALEYMKERYRLNSLPIVKIDQQGRSYLWLKFQLSHAVQEFKIIIIGEMVNFFKHYQSGIIRPDFDLNDLFLEASKTEA